MHVDGFTNKDISGMLIEWSCACLISKLDHMIG